MRVTPMRTLLIALAVTLSSVFSATAAAAGTKVTLDENGVLVFHISNRHMELASVVAAVGEAEGLVTYVKEDSRPEPTPQDYKMNAIVAVLARSQADLGTLPQHPGWREMKPQPGTRAWTDDYSNILGAILRKKSGG